MIQKIKELRVKIDGISQLVKELRPIPPTETYRLVFLEEPPKSIHLGNNSKNSDEIKESYKSLILAKAWLGKVLQELGDSTPYINDGIRKTIEDMEPTADTNRGVLHDLKEDETPWKEKSHIEKVDWLREEIKKTIDIIPDYQLYVDNLIDEFYKNIEETSKEDFCKIEQEFMSNIPNIEPTISFAYQHLSEARFLLGFELGRVRDNQ